MVFFAYSNISSTYRGGYLRYIFQYVSQLPIYKIDFSNPEDVKRHDLMVNLVQHMLDLQKRVPATPLESEQLGREIQSTDRQIDALVYDLYNLAPEEIAIVEGK